MHGSANLAASLVFPEADAGTLFAFSAAGTALVAIPLVLLSWSRWSRAPDAEPDPAVTAIPIAAEADLLDVPPVRIRADAIAPSTVVSDGRSD